MADDGMLLNFELPSDAFIPKRTVKGGNWKDRLTARKSAEYGRKKTQERAAASKKTIPRYQEVSAEHEELILPDSQPRKRPKTDARTVDRRNLPDSRAQQQGRGGSSVTRPNEGVVASLFTYNATSTIVPPDPQAEDEKTLEPSNAPLHDALTTFTNLGLSSMLSDYLLNKLDIKAPTAIQRKAIQQLCANDTDAFIQAETGSGKTLAYLLPILQRITQLSKHMKQDGQPFDRESGLVAIILAPTRELSKQISTVLDGLLSCCHWIVGGTVIGGEKKKSEKARLRKGLNILVATPGRLVDHLDNTEVLDVSKVRWLVLDEGDRLTELGFEKDIQKIVSVLNLRGKTAQAKSLAGLPDRRTTVLCSATLKANVDQLKTIALKDPVSIAVDEHDQLESQDATTKQQTFSAPAQLKQSYVVVPPKQRLVTLVATLKQTFRRKGSVVRCIVFMSCADSVDFHFEALSRPMESQVVGQHDVDAESDGRTMQRPPTSTLSRSDKIPQGSSIAESRTQGLATAFTIKENPVQLFRLHGSLQQSTRTGTLMAFTKCPDPSVLVCTDVASRGLDLLNVDLVIEYDPPFSKDDHLHRIGRTARAGKDGRAMIFLMPGSEENYVEVLKEGRRRNLTRHDASEFLKKGFSASPGMSSEKEWEDRATEWQLDLERWAIENPKHLEQARRAFQSHIRAYATHVSAERGIFDMMQLHLGHLAKAFALRDKPGSIRVPGLRPSNNALSKSNIARKANVAKQASSDGKRVGRGDNFDAQPDIDERDARKKMRAKMQALSGASEFNLG